MAGIDNLRVPTSEQAREYGRRGGMASAKAKKERKAMKETVELLLNMALTSDKNCNIEKIRNFASLNGKNVTVQDAILIKQVQKALKGDTQAVNILRELTGERVQEIKVAQVMDDKVKELEAYLNEKE